MLQLPFWMAALLFVYLFMLGACITSFLFVIAFREASGSKQPFYQGRSHCDTCNAILTARDLVPIFSWLASKGRCRHCGAKIPAIYPIGEALGGMGMVLAFWAYATQPAKLLVAIGVWVFLMLIALYDSLTMEIPDLYTLLLAVPCLLSLWVFDGPPLPGRILGIFIVSVPMLLLALLIPGAFGGGDIQLMAVCGFLLGWQNTLVAFFLSLVAAMVQIVLLLASGKIQLGKSGQHMPFGPALCAGCYLSLLFGDSLLHWYTSLFH